MIMHFLKERHEKNMKKIMQTKNVNKRFTAIPTMIKHENHTIDNRAKISENSNDFLRFFSKEFEAKVSPSHEKVHENTNAIFNQQS